jgi:hypothetical protein
MPNDERNARAVRPLEAVRIRLHPSQRTAPRTTREPRYGVSGKR